MVVFSFFLFYSLIHFANSKSSSQHQFVYRKLYDSCGRGGLYSIDACCPERERAPVVSDLTSVESEGLLAVRVLSVSAYGRKDTPCGTNQFSLEDGGTSTHCLCGLHQVSVVQYTGCPGQQRTLGNPKLVSYSVVHYLVSAFNLSDREKFNAKVCIESRTRPALNR